MRLAMLLLAFATVASPVHATWLKIESRHFIGYSDGSAEELKADIVRLEQFDALLRDRLSVGDTPSPIKLSVFMIRNINVVTKLIGDGIAGYYTASAEGPMAVVPRDDGGSGKFALTSVSILYHEYVHHVMSQYFTAPDPYWYSEGFAEFMAGTQFDGNGKAKLGLGARYRAYGLARGFDIPINVLLSPTKTDLSRYDGDTFYGRSWLLTHYLSFSKGRRGQLQKYLNLIRDGVESMDAAQQAFGNIALLGKELDRYRVTTSIPYVEVAIKPIEIGALQLSTLSQGQGEMMLDRIIMMGETRKNKSAARASALRKIANRYPDDAEVVALLAQAECGAQEWALCIAAADAALKINAGSARALLWKGEALQMQLVKDKSKDPAKWSEARSWIVKANRVNPDSAGPLIAYYKSYAREGRDAPEVAFQGLAKALVLIPQQENIRLTYAFAMARKKRFADAIVALRILTNAPHGSKYGEFVTRVIVRFEAAKAKGSIDGLDELEKSATDLDDS